MTDTGYYLLVFQYYDKSGTTICGLTQNTTVVQAWRAAGGEHKVFRIELDSIKDKIKGWEEWL